MIERDHKFIINALIKMTNEKITNWIENLSIVFWIDRITVRQNIEYTSFYFNCDYEIVMFIELNISIWQILSWNKVHDIAELIAMRIKQIQRKNENLSKTILFFQKMKKQKKKIFDIINSIKKISIYFEMMILLYDIKLNNNHTKKFLYKWFKFYIIENATEKNIYILMKLNKIKFIDIYSKNRLK